LRITGTTFFQGQGEGNSAATQEELAKAIFQTLYTRDVRLIEKILTHLQYENDLARLQASREKAIAAGAAFKQSRQEAGELRNRIGCELYALFDNVASHHRETFMTTPLYQLTRPYITAFCESHKSEIRPLTHRGTRPLGRQGSSWGAQAGIHGGPLALTIGET
jgi:hypothetical protein